MIGQVVRDTGDFVMTEEEKRLQLENKKLLREIKRIKKDNDVLRLANEQSSNTQAYLQRSMTQQAAYITQFLESAPYFILITDDRLRTIMVSDIYFEYEHSHTKEEISHGIAAEQILGDFFFGTALSTLLEKCRRCLAGERIKPYIQRFMKDGKLYAIENNIRPMMEDSGIIGLSLIQIDVTDFVTAMEQAKNADRAKSNFLANMSHEIRTPMNVIAGMSEFILRDSQDEEAKKNARMIKNATKSLLSIINDILDFSKIESGKMDFVEDPFMTASLINDVATMMRIRIEEKALEFILDIDESIPSMLMGDEGRIKQILINLLTNAIKFTKKGHICWRIRSEKEDDRNIRLWVDVEDTGIGIKKENLENIFSDFTQVDTRRNRSEEGTGLGLAISKRLARHMDGDVYVKSTYGKGSTFSFDISLRVVDWTPMGRINERKIENQAEIYRPSIVVKDVQVLVVDDNEMNLEVTAGILEPYGIETTCADSGEKAIDLFKKGRFDLIFMDHMMPVMDGVETMKKIRKLPGGKKAVIIVLTANALSGAPIEYKRLGFQDFLAKPLEPRNMDRIMRAYLPEEKIIKE